MQKTESESKRQKQQGNAHAATAIACVLCRGVVHVEAAYDSDDTKWSATCLCMAGKADVFTKASIDSITRTGEPIHSAHRAC